MLLGIQTTKKKNTCVGFDRPPHFESHGCWWPEKGEQRVLRVDGWVFDQELQGDQKL